LSNGIISGIPLQGGTISAQITATNTGPNNSGGTDSKQILLNITAPPVITSPLIIPATRGQPINYRIQATSSPTSFGFDTNPPHTVAGVPTATIAGGITINASGQQTGILSGTPTTAGRFLAVVVANNTLNQLNDPCTFSIPGGTGTAQVIFAVSDPAGAPAITCPVSVSGIVATTILVRCYGDECANLLLCYRNIARRTYIKYYDRHYQWRASGRI